MRRTGLTQILCLVLFLFIALAGQLPAEEPTVKVGVATVLSGDFASLGQNIVRTIETYKKQRLRHPIEFVFEDARISSQDGLRAYQALINVEKVDLIIGANSSNATMASSALINSTKTVMLTPSTGGGHIDHAGEYIFRIGNSDVQNGIDQADLFIKKKYVKVALLTEQTEYTEDISQNFENHFKKLGGELVYHDAFAPGTTDFRSQASRILKAQPQALFVPTQTGLALALLLKQLDQLGGFKGEIHTTFVAAPNADARKVAGDLMKGVFYMDPAYDENNPELQKFIAHYREDHKKDPDIAFHTAGTIDALDMLQLYLDQHKTYNREGFKDFLLKQIKDYKGMKGTYSFDAEGNANLGFRSAVIK